MFGRIVLAVGVGLLLLLMAVVWLDAVQPYVASRLALQQMEGDEAAIAALRVSGRLASYLPLALSCVYVVCCLAIFCVDPKWVRRITQRKY